MAAEKKNWTEFEILFYFKKRMKFIQKMLKKQKKARKIL